MTLAITLVLNLAEQLNPTVTVPERKALAWFLCNEPGGNGPGVDLTLQLYLCDSEGLTVVDQARMAGRPMVVEWLERRIQSHRGALRDGPGPGLL